MLPPVGEGRKRRSNMETSFANIKFSSVWEVVIIAFIFSFCQILVVIIKRIIEHTFSHEPTREDKIANEIYEKVKGHKPQFIEEDEVRARIGEFNLIRELLKKPFKDIKSELKGNQ